MNQNLFKPNPFKSIRQQVEKNEIPPEEMRSRFETFITNRKRVTRLAFVQSIFLYNSMLISGETEGKTPQAIGRNILATIVYFYKTVFYADSKHPWKMETLDGTIAAILRCGTYELMFNGKVEPKIVMSEYTNLTHAFFDGPEIGFINALLDKISHNI